MISFLFILLSIVNRLLLGHIDKLIEELLRVFLVLLIYLSDLVLLLLLLLLLHHSYLLLHVNFSPQLL